MTRDERIILKILSKRGPQAVYNVDRWFNAEGGENFGPSILSGLVDRGLVAKSEGRYSITASGEQELKDAA